MRIEGLKRRFKTDKHFRRSICALFLVVGLAVTGLTLAYFTSADKVTNRLKSDAPVSEIRLTEPQWDSTGQAKAEKFVAGMEIEKDPYTTSYMNPDVYIRLKISCLDNDGNPIDWGNYIYYNNDLLLSSTTSSNNSYFYNDGYFYYVESDELKSLTYTEKTDEPLFDSVHLPVLDSEYIKFKNGFKIVVTAEAVDVDEITEASTDDISTIASAFVSAKNSDAAADIYATAEVTNDFTPGSVSVSVKENDTILTENNLTWESDTAKKEVQIHCNENSDDTNYTSCYVRVCLLPEWKSKVDNTDVEVLDNENTDSDKNDIVFPSSITGNTFTIDGVTFTLAKDWSDNWIYKDGYFYYKKILAPGDDTELLLKSVSVTASDLTKHTDNGEYLGVSVLTDAIQSDGEAAAQKWNATVESDVITAIGG